MKGIFWGVLGLTFLDIILTSKVDIPGAFQGFAAWVAEWMDPNVPLIKAAAPPATVSTAPTVPPVQTLSAPGNLPPFLTGGTVQTSRPGATIAIT